MKNGMKVYVMETGCIEQDLSTLIAGLTMADVNNKQKMPIWNRTPTYTVLIEHPEGNVLFDTSCHPKAMTERWTEEIKLYNPYVVDDDSTFPARLEQLNMRPKDIKHVVISHMHMDHTGCLEMFKDSNVIVHDTEFTQAMKRYGLKKDLGVYVWKDIDEQLKADLHWNLFSPEKEKAELVDGVTIYNFGSGHAFGMLSLLIELPSGKNILLASDSIYTSTNYGPPAKLPSIMYDSLGLARTTERIREIAEEKNAEVWFGHDRQQFDTLIKSHEGFYE